MDGAPLPEPQWKFRRALTFGVTIFSALFVSYAAVAFVHAGAVAFLLTLTLALIIRDAALQVIYLIAPSAEYVSKIAELVRAARGEPPQ